MKNFTLYITLLILMFSSCMGNGKKYCEMDFSKVENEYIEPFRNDSKRYYENSDGDVKTILIKKGELFEENELTEYGIQRNPTVSYIANFKSAEGISYEDYNHFGLTKYCYNMSTEYLFWFGDLGIITTNPEQYLQKEFIANGNKFKNILIFNHNKDSSKIETMIWDKEDGLIGFKIRNEASFYLVKAFFM